MSNVRGVAFCDADLGAPVCKTTAAGGQSMGTKNYYMVLGVEESESPEAIRAAFRDLVRKNHPDRAGPKRIDTFREIVEAYETLSDPDRRRDHNFQLHPESEAEVKA